MSVSLSPVKEQVASASTNCKYGEMAERSRSACLGSDVSEVTRASLSASSRPSRIEGLMLELFGVSKCHGVEREEKSQRGFRGVKILGDREPTQSELV